jgi:ubiquinone/menaquinone biosynthesis C-methylase UbiE
MEETTSDRHAALIQDQFTRQARAFAEAMAHSDESAIALLMDAVEPRDADVALDVACGPGIVVCALAQRVAFARGLDVVPAMLAQARQRQYALGLRNIAWDLGNSTELPYRDGTFDIVTTRYSLHHLLDPSATVRQMARVCRPGGRVAVIDVAPSPDLREGYDAAERIRDPSHVRALIELELEDLLAASGLDIAARARYLLDMELEAVLAASFPEVLGRERLRALFQADIGVNALGMAARQEGETIRFSYPILMLVGTKRYP